MFNFIKNLFSKKKATVTKAVTPFQKRIVASVKTHFETITMTEVGPDVFYISIKGHLSNSGSITVRHGLNRATREFEATVGIYTA